MKSTKTLDISVLTEEDLVQRLKHKDEKSFTYVYDMYSPALFSILVKILPVTHDAEDALHETFIKVWKNIASYDSGKGRLFTWMLNIARNHAFDVLKYQDLRKNNRAGISYMHPDGERDDSFRHLDHFDIQHFVSKLNTDLRVLIFLSYYYGFSHCRMAELLNIPVGTIKTRMRKAYNVLRAGMYAE